MATYRIVGGDGQEYGPVGEQEIRDWIREGRANGDTLARAEGGAWKKLAQFPEFADLLRVQGPPVVPTGLASGLPVVSMPPVMDGDPKGKVLGPAIALVATAIMDLLLMAFGVLAGFLGWTASWLGMGHRSPGFGDPQLDHLFEYWIGPMGMAGNLFSLAINAFIIWAALRMMSLRSYGLCMAAAVVAVVPCTTPCCCLGMAAGVWALVVLTRPEVKQSFS